MRRTTMGRSTIVWTAVAGLILTAFTTMLQAQGVQGTNRYIVPPPKPGGINPTPYIHTLTTGEEMTLKWNGFLGPYQLQRSTELGPGGTWENVGASTSQKWTTHAPAGGVEFLRVTGPTPEYAGAETCMLCHSGTHTTWLTTRHATALETLKNIGQGANSRCLPCHTVGYGFETGYIDETTTDWLAGVQCENCHGPAAAHASSPGNLSLRPVRTAAAQTCGGCHTDAHHPTYDEWSDSNHSAVTATVASRFFGTGGTTNTSTMLSCGPCHSGGVRMRLLQQLAKPSTPLPSPEDAAEISQTCAICHNPHAETGNPHQLRNPRFSNAFFSYSTSSSTTFSNQYNANIQTCAQCHNSRGGVPTDTSRPPHHSPQYNMLIGQATPESYTLWTLQTNAQITATHGMQAAQCTACHTHPHSVENPSEENPNYTGHNFEPHLFACVDCHGSEEAAAGQIEATQTEIHHRIQEVKALLDQWGETKSVEALRNKYGPLAWEYSNVGQISNPNGNVGPGPTSTEQADVPQGIKEARFYLYIVEHDGSFGVHNGKYARFLLNQAETNVVNLLNAP